MNLHSPAQYARNATTTASGSPGTLRVQLAHPCPIICAGLAAILTRQNGFDIEAAAAYPSNGDNDCIVITDYESGMRATAAHWPGRHRRAPCVLIFTTRDTEWEVQQAVVNGVHGYLVQGCGPDELMRCLRKLGCGVSYISPMVTHRLIDALGRTALTRRETDVLRVLARGLPDKLIGRELGVGLGTVKSHLKNIMQKLEAITRTQVVVIAIRRGLLPAPVGPVAVDKPTPGRGAPLSQRIAPSLADNDPRRRAEMTDPRATLSEH